MNWLEGAYDIHVHASPSLVPRRYTIAEALALADGAGLAGILYLDHSLATAPVAQVLNRTGHHTRVYSAIMLNPAVGGLDPTVVETAVALGTDMVEMPTYSARYHVERYGVDTKLFPHRGSPSGVTVLDEDGTLLPVVEEILEVLAAGKRVLATGHLGPREIATLARRARELGIRVVIPSVSTDIMDLPLELQHELAGIGVYLEHDFLALTDIPHRSTPAEAMAAQIRAVGVEHCILATDVGQPTCPDLVTAMNALVKALLDCGITEREIIRMIRDNPRHLLTR